MVHTEVRGSGRFGRARRQKFRGNGRHSHRSDVIRFQLSKGHSLVRCGLSGLEGDSLRDGTSPSTWLQLCELLKTVTWINRKWREREPDWRGNSCTEWVQFGDWLATWHEGGKESKMTFGFLVWAFGRWWSISWNGDIHGAALVFLRTSCVSWAL